MRRAGREAGQAAALRRLDAGQPAPLCAEAGPWLPCAGPNSGSALPHAVCRRSRTPFTKQPALLPPSCTPPGRPMQGLIHARGFDLADEHKCLLVSLEDCTPEQLPPGHAPLPPEYHKRKTVNFLHGSCLRLRQAQPRTTADVPKSTAGSVPLYSASPAAAAPLLGQCAKSAPARTSVQLQNASAARCRLPCFCPCWARPPSLQLTKCVCVHRGRPPLCRPLPAAPDGTPRTEGSLLLHLDPHIPFIPAFLLNFVLGVLAP